ncbi:hypothetical protein Fcan01_22272 [Folsomia candida]|uniref:Uncharacterized protein n=1 Tax=Folsomia candida TaxID=158441 RepID=A0A226DFC8_FOLCA|nr:hypothetical protein Fcan01_22272 [Folsomia candida]
MWETSFVTTSSEISLFSVANRFIIGQQIDQLPAASIPANFYLKTSILPPATFYPQPNASPQRLPPATTVVYETPCTTTPCPSTPQSLLVPQHLLLHLPAVVETLPKTPFRSSTTTNFSFHYCITHSFPNGDTYQRHHHLSRMFTPDSNSPPFFPQVCPNTELEPLPTPAAPLPANIFVPPHILPSFQPVPPHHTNAFYRPPFPPSHISTIDGDFCACLPHNSHIDNLTGSLGPVPDHISFHAQQSAARVERRLSPPADINRIIDTPAHPVGHHQRTIQPRRLDFLASPALPFSDPAPPPSSYPIALWQPQRNIPQAISSIRKRKTDEPLYHPSYQFARAGTSPNGTFVESPPRYSLDQLSRRDRIVEEALPIRCKYYESQATDPCILLPDPRSPSTYRRPITTYDPLFHPARPVDPFISADASAFSSHITPAVAHNPVSHNFGPTALEQFLQPVINFPLSTSAPRQNEVVAPHPLQQVTNFPIPTSSHLSEIVAPPPQKNEVVATPTNDITLGQRRSPQKESPTSSNSPLSSDSDSPNPVTGTLPPIQAFATQPPAAPISANFFIKPSILNPAPFQPTPIPNAFHQPPPSAPPHVSAIEIDQTFQNHENLPPNPSTCIGATTSLAPAPTASAVVAPALPPSIPYPPPLPAPLVPFSQPVHRSQSLTSVNSSLASSITHSSSDCSTTKWFCPPTFHTYNYSHHNHSATLPLCRQLYSNYTPYANPFDPSPSELNGDGGVIVPSESELLPLFPSPVIPWDTDKFIWAFDSNFNRWEPTTTDSHLYIDAFAPTLNPFTHHLVPKKRVHIPTDIAHKPPLWPTPTLSISPGPLALPFTFCLHPEPLSLSFPSDSTYCNSRSPTATNFPLSSNQSGSHPAVGMMGNLPPTGGAPPPYSQTTGGGGPAHPPPSGGSNPPPSGSHPLPGGPHHHPGGSHPPPGGSHPPPGSGAPPPLVLLISPTLAEPVAVAPPPPPV